MTHYIYSTHTNSIQYVEYETNTVKNHNVIKRRFVVTGGHGLTDKHLQTKEGVVTRVDRDDDMEWLLTLDSFKSDIKKGFITYSKRKEEPQKMVAKDMTKADGSAPITPKDYVLVDKKNNIYKSISASATL